LNAELSTVALPLTPGKRVKVYFGGEGVDQVPGTSIVVNSPFFSVDPASLAREQIAAPFPVVSVELQVAANVPFGDYSLRLQSNSGETAYIPGAITIDPGVGSSVVNPVDDSRFFITQQFADLTGGTLFNPSASRDLGAIYQKILDELGGQYVLGYVSDNQKADGKLRRLVVELPNRKDLKVRHRTGYMGKAKEENR